ncbi:O-antigen ligase family protein [Psychrobacillus psychrodurans]|uniref:O-antigen ligase family protein n=1 Tax=Psychrobacillus psychrodurans TaxID=126157 RepID=A0A9X3R9A1_9BACI|nr:O-antigen ligase family protein [Psychrobacillus psychrodurans]MCZ8532022.1 O-antigen ligase family protein [Psychrobacillus psychrodurans]
MAHLTLNKIKIDRDINEDSESIRTIDKFIFYILLAAIAIIPIVIGAHTALFISPDISGLGANGTAYQTDIFTYYKFVLLIIFTISTVILFLYKLLFLNYEFKKDRVNFAIYAFIFFLLMSVIFAEYKTIAIWGMHNRHDGAIAYICFSILMLVALNIKYPKNALKIVTYALYPFVWINLVIALLTFYGKNIMLNDMVSKILTIFDKSGVTFDERSILTGTLNQWNYMSGMSGILVMIFLTLAIFQKSVRLGIINLLTASAAFATLLVSISSSGFLAFIVMTIFMLVVLVMKGNKKKGLFTIISFLLIASLQIGILSTKNNQVWDESIGMFVKTNPFIKEDGSLGLFGNKTYAADNEFDLPVLPERGLAGGSGRIYIWSEMLKLVSEKPLYGYGLDTIIFHFPQNELEKRAELWDEKGLVDKPHNMYFGILWGTGLFGLLAFAFILTMLTRTILKTVYKKTFNTSSYFVALSMGFGAFLIQALFNDSVIGLTIAPLLIGTILYANHINDDLTEETS